ncbi:FHA domain-containing protein FhaB/FipA [Aquipuribacter sp. SD81]|uniref:FHA domain-containing protein FhaB/FipA n=1 Tax=Aquipuribacter sp. SD81 TaxID=3127703 RepID=UPI0030171C80
MSELTLTVLQLGLLVLLWLFVLGVVGVLRGDLYGTRVAVRQPRQAREAPARGARGQNQPAQPVPSGQPAQPQQAAPQQPAAPRQPALPRQLVVTEGSLRGTTITLGTSAITIGRAADCTLVVDDEYASGRHARISRADGQWVLEDLGSTNGTYVRKEQVQGTVPLQVRVPIRIGRTVLELRA